jgi:predicted transposase YdaD
LVKVADIGGKRLISLAPDAWAQWVTQQLDVVALEIMGSDFQWVSRENDVLIKAYSPQLGEFLILTELQLRYNTKLPLRIRAYAALAQEKYGLPVYPVLINILPPPSTTMVSDRFSESFLGLEARQDFRVINLWEVEAQTVFDLELTALLPFVPILKDGAEQATVQQALDQLRQDEELVELESLLGFFASFVLETDVVRQIMRWDMAVLKESPWYQEILLQGEKLGEQRGRQEGERSLILRLLNRKFGALPESLRLRVEALNLEQLETLSEALLDFSTVHDLLAWLDTQC